MEPTLHIRLLGDFSLIYDNRQVTSLNTMRLQSLLAYLVLHRDAPQQRQHLAFLFWPDTTEAQARNNLRQLLHQLRQVFPAVEHFLSADTHTLYWHPQEPCHIDIAEFEQALTEATAGTQRNDQHAQQIALEQADSLYRGALLPGCYDEWILPERERHRQLSLHALESLCDHLTAAGRYGAAVQAGLAAVDREPLRESAHRALVRAHLAEGNAWEAIRRYRHYEKIAARDLGVEPSPMMRSLLSQVAAV